jgi:hypothetical protein
MLKLAHDAGWSLTTGGHGFGRLSCPAGEHTISVDGTAKGGETKAKEVPKRLRQCQHGSASAATKVPARMAECELLLARTDELIAAAKADLWRAEEQQHALAELDRLSLILDTADANLEEVLAAAQDEALERAVELEGAPSQDAIGSVIDEAARVVDKADEVAGKIRRTGIAGPLKARANTAKAQIAGLRMRLATL